MNPPAKEPAPTSACDNCQTPLLGNFCHHCGQENKDYVRNALALIAEFLGEFSNWDNRLWRTLWPLWLKPAYLSRRFVEGHRAPYVPPLRLYIFTSIVAFVILAQLVPAESLKPPPDFMPDGRPVAEQAGQSIPAETPPASPPVFEAGRLQLAFMNAEQERELEQKLAAFVESPQLGFNRFFSLAPQMMFLLLPVFALLLKLLYIRRGHYYLEHLTLALHSHSFILQLMVVYIGISLAAGALAQVPVIPTLLGYLTTVLFWSVPLYLLVGQKIFYRQSWTKTLIKFGITGFAYLALLGSALLGVMIVSIMGS